MEVLVQLTQQEHFNTGTRLFLIAVQTGRKDLGVIKDKHILIIKIVQDILKLDVLNLAGRFMHHHQPRLVAILGRIQRYLLFRQFEFEL